MAYKKIGSVSFNEIPESIKTILKIKEDTWLCNLSKSFCQEHKINPENLKFDILKDSKNKIWFAQVGQPTDNLTLAKMEITNAK